jgi:uncharacterized protein
LSDAPARVPECLDDAQVERLSELLEQHAVPAQGMNLEALDGFLSALAVAPGKPVPYEEWSAEVWGSAPRLDAREQAEEAERLLRGHFNACQARVRSGEPPEHLAPLLWLPEDPLEDHPDELDVGRDWALGFYRGVDLRNGDWDAWLDREDWVDEIFELLERLATGVVEGAEEGDPPQRLSYRERLEITASLPAMLADLASYKAEQAGRSSGR